MTRPASSGGPPAATDRAGVAMRMEAVTKHYGRALALDAVDLNVEPGCFLVLLGPSGSGKSTLARCLAGVERIDGGKIHLGGRLVGDSHHHLPPERRNLAMVFQDYALWPHLSALANVAYALRRHRLDGAETARRAGDALARVGLEEFGGRYPHELSGGQQQRVALARAVVARPGLLLFDEPLSNLDTDLREHLRVEIATVTRERGATAVYITHDQSEAFALADLIAVLDRGRLVQYGPPEEIYRRPASPFVARFTGLAGELKGRTVRLDGDQVVVDLGPARIRAMYPARRRHDGGVGVLIRPAATSILAAPVATADGTLRATVVDVAYRGRGYDHVVDCGCGTLTSVFDRQRYPRGHVVTVGLDAAGCIAFPDPFPCPVVIDGAADSDIGELTAVTVRGMERSESSQ